MLLGDVGATPSHGRSRRAAAIATAPRPDANSRSDSKRRRASLSSSVSGAATSRATSRGGGPRRLHRVLAQHQLPPRRADGTGHLLVQAEGRVLPVRGAQRAARDELTDDAAPESVRVLLADAVEGKLVVLVLADHLGGLATQPETMCSARSAVRCGRWPRAPSVLRSVPSNEATGLRQLSQCPHLPSRASPKQASRVRCARCRLRQPDHRLQALAHDPLLRRRRRRLSSHCRARATSSPP